MRSIALSLTDAATDLTGVTAIKITFSSIQVHVADKDEGKDGDPAIKKAKVDGKEFAF